MGYILQATQKPIPLSRRAHIPKTSESTFAKSFIFSIKAVKINKLNIKPIRAAKILGPAFTILDSMFSNYFIFFDILVNRLYFESSTLRNAKSIISNRIGMKLFVINSTIIVIKVNAPFIRAIFSSILLVDIGQNVFILK